MLTVIYRNDIVSAALEAVAQNNELDFKSQTVDITASLNLKNTALLFGNVEVKSRKGVSGVSLALQAETLRAEVDLLRFVLHREVKIEKLLAKNGQLSLRLAPSRSNSPEASPQMPDTEALLAGLKRIQLEQCRLSVENISGGRNVAIAVQALSADVEPAGDGLNLHAKGQLTVQASERQEPAQRTATSISVDVKGNLSRGVATATACKLSVDGVALEATGSVAFRPLGEVSVSVAAKNLSLERAIRQIRKYVALSAPERLSGRASVNAHLSGSLGEKATLSVKGFCTARGVALKLKDVEEFSAKSLRCSVAARDVRNLQSYTCTISSDDVAWRSFHFSGEGEIRSFKSPLYEVNANFLGDLAALNVESLPEGSVKGAARLRIRDWSRAGIEELGLQADVSNLKATLQGEVYTLSGQLTADKGTLEPQLQISSAAVEGTFQGAVQGYLTALLGEREATTLKISGNLDAKRLNLDRLLAQGDSAASARVRVYASVRARADELTVFDRLYTNVSGAVDYSPRSLTLNKLSVEAFDGTLGGDVKLYTGAGGNSRLGCDLYFNGVALENLPYLNEKLNIKSGSMQGKCSGAITLTSSVGREGLDMDNLSATLNFTISNGRLLEFAPIQPLSAYLKKSLLQDVRFSALQNTLSLENGKITIPKMEVRSTALNALIAGTQDLKGDFDYHITLYLNELLSRKEKDIDNPIKENKTKLFLRFTSKNGVAEVTHDAREWSKNMEQKVQREAQEIKGLLRSAKGKDKGEARAQGEKASRAAAPEKVAVEWEEDESVGAAPKKEKPEKEKPEKEKAEPKPTPKPDKPAQKKKRSDVEVEWDELN
ncbi:MAG: AsmA-like C-terminal region-containing protein [Prevotellaceae bacterium]|jgi:hypothetical protein|nr:AsmA-like C-terminal region-containing protein [Prevotellaceae bacterium]